MALQTRVLASWWRCFREFNNTDRVIAYDVYQGAAFPVNALATTVVPVPRVSSSPPPIPHPFTHSLTPSPNTVTQGNHSAIQSEFATPCIPAHDTNITVNGFNSGFRDAGNGTAITNLPVTISDNSTIWFYDANTCAQGGVGGINVNESSTETLDGFRVSFLSSPRTRGSR